MVLKLVGRDYRIVYHPDKDNDFTCEVLDLVNRKIFKGKPQKVEIENNIDRWFNSYKSPISDYCIVFYEYEVFDLTDDYLAKNIIFEELKKNIDDEKKCDAISSDIHKQLKDEELLK